jgi:hypothetical protein
MNQSLNPLNVNSLLYELYLGNIYYLNSISFNFLPIISQNPENSLKSTVFEMTKSNFLKISSMVESNISVGYPFSSNKL